MGNCNSLFYKDTDVRLWKYDTANLVGLGCHYAVEVDGQLWEFTGDKKGSKLSMNVGVSVANSMKKNGPHYVHNQHVYACKVWEKKSREQMEEFCHTYAMTTPFDYELVVDNGKAFALAFISFLLDGHDVPFKTSSIFATKQGSLDSCEDSVSDYDDHNSETASEGSDDSYDAGYFEMEDTSYLLNKKMN